MKKTTIIIFTLILMVSFLGGVSVRSDQNFLPVTYKIEDSEYILVEILKPNGSEIVEACISDQKEDTFILIDNVFNELIRLSPDGEFFYRIKTKKGTDPRRIILMR